MDREIKREETGREGNQIEVSRKRRYSQRARYAAVIRHGLYFLSSFLFPSLQIPFSPLPAITMSITVRISYVQRECHRIAQKSDRDASMFPGRIILRPRTPKLIKICIGRTSRYLLFGLKNTSTVDNLMFRYLNITYYESIIQFLLNRVV